jgi:hypothetical protein
MQESTLGHLGQRLWHRLSPRARGVIGAGGQIRLGEHFELWVAGPNAVSRPRQPLERTARRSGYWHHQIRHNGIGVEYARSKQHGAGDTDWEIHAVMTPSDASINGNAAPLAARIDAAIGYVDSLRNTERAEVRLLEFPGYFTTCLWLHYPDEPDRLILVTAPSEAGGLSTRRLYTVAKVLRRLALRRPALGIVADAPG